MSEGSSGGREEIGTRKGFKGSLGLEIGVGGKNGLWESEGMGGCLLRDGLGGEGRKGFDEVCSAIGEREGRW